MRLSRVLTVDMPRHLSISRRLLTPDQLQPVAATSGAWQEWLDSALGDLQARRLLRSLRAVDPVRRSSTRVRLPEDEGKQVVVFAANDYLGLSSAPEVQAAASAAALEFGSGPRGSALVCGYTVAHRELERDLASLKGTEEALLFPTGFAANLAVLGALITSPSCAIFSDSLNHASIVDGARLAAKSTGASLHVSSHSPSSLSQ